MRIRSSVPLERLLAVAVIVLAVATAGGAVAQLLVSDGTGSPLAGIDSGEDDRSSLQTLVVADAETGDRLLEVAVTDGDEVTLAYTHSVEKTPVKDVYVVDGAALHMDRMVFSSFGAGLPSEANVTHTEDGFVVSVDQRFEDLYVVPGSIAGHTLHVGETCYDLVERADGATVRLFVETGDGVEADDSGRP